ncbi:hypothetical protein BC629DRAFT_754944 [Irpex lacteus]|nr:hypothetical protein BC629DRAFT_754944 [Irpex lacteus]
MRMRRVQSGSSVPSHFVLSTFKTAQYPSSYSGQCPPWHAPELRTYCTHSLACRLRGCLTDGVVRPLSPLSAVGPKTKINVAWCSLAAEEPAVSYPEKFSFMNLVHILTGVTLGGSSATTPHHGCQWPVLGEWRRR